MKIAWSTALSLTTALCLGLVNINSYAATPTTTETTATPTESPIPQPGGYSNISNTLLQSMLDQGITVIDIRREEEWRETGIIEGVTPITFFQKNGRLNPNFLDSFNAVTSPDKPVALICRSGNRTQAASKAIAQQLGYKEVYNVTYGIKGWLKEKRPVVSYK